MPAIMPRTPEINPCRKTPQNVFVPKSGDKMFKLMYATEPMKNEAPRLWKKVLKMKDSPSIKSLRT